MLRNWDMKKIVIWLLVILVCSFGIAGLISISEGSQGMSVILNNGEKAGEVKVDEKKDLKLEGISVINVNAVNTDITVTPYEGNTVKVHFYGDSSRSTNLPELLTGEAGKNINIEIKHPASLTFSIGMKIDKFYLDIQVPKNYSGSLNLKNISGKIEANDLNLKVFSMNSVSGALKGTNINVSEEVLLKTISGEIKFAGGAGSFKAESVSGAIDINQNTLKADISLSTISGNIILQIPSGSEFDYKLKSTSGRIINEFKGSEKLKGTAEGTIGKGSFSLDAHSVSGNIDIIKD